MLDGCPLIVSGILWIIVLTFSRYGNIFASLINGGEDKNCEQHPNDTCMKLQLKYKKCDGAVYSPGL